MSRLKQIATLRSALIDKHNDLFDRVTAIRERSIANLPELALQAKEMLEAKLAKVYPVKDEQQAAKILSDILKGEKQVSRSFSNTMTEIKFDHIMADMGIKVNLTRLEEIVNSEKGLPYSGHPHLVNIDLSTKIVREALQKYTNHKDTLEPSELRRLASQRVKESILSGEYGITGVNGVVAENGSLVLAEDEGNVRAVSNLPYRHVAIVGLDKIDQSAEDAMSVIQALSIFGAGQITPTYFSLIAGPSRTADIEFKMAYGMHGPKEVHVLMLDNGRLSIREQGAGALLKCINCGCCFENCAELASKQKWEDTMLSPKGLALGIVQGKLSPLQEMKDMSEFLCPVGLSPEDVIANLGTIKP